jgi:hypothetical protein
MTRDEAVAMMKVQLGFRSDLDSTIITNLKLAQTLLEKEPTKPWFCISEESTLTTTADDQRVGFPTGFIEEVDRSKLYYVPADTTEEHVFLTKDDYDVLAAQYVGADAGAPEAYALLGNYFRIFPTPDDAYTLKITFVESQTVLTTNIENNWLLHAPLLLMGSAGVLTATALRDTHAMNTFSGWENKGRMLLYSENETRDHANRTYQIGGPH